MLLFLLYHLKYLFIMNLVKLHKYANIVSAVLSIIVMFGSLYVAATTFNKSAYAVFIVSMIVSVLLIYHYFEFTSKS